MPRGISGIHHIAISVENLERSRNFYKEFGFKEEKRFERKDLRGKAAFLKLGNMRIEIWEFEDKLPENTIPDIRAAINC
ncbi:MAG: hypothetical protein FJY98_02345 [Candidatus Liptonbacteria bacterium]|nr:hypothetical protein [Candidatus Liptonbacteria bacterium]